MEQSSFSCNKQYKYILPRLLHKSVAIRAMWGSHVHSNYWYIDLSAELTDHLTNWEKMTRPIPQNRQCSVIMSDLVSRIHQLTSGRSKVAQEFAVAAVVAEWKLLCTADGRDFLLHIINRKKWIIDYLQFYFKICSRICEFHCWNSVTLMTNVLMSDTGLHAANKQ